MAPKDQHFQAFATELRRAVKNLKAGDLFAGLPATMWAKRAAALASGETASAVQVAACLYMSSWVAAGRPDAAGDVQDDDDEEAMPA